MIICGANTLSKNSQKVDALNVFPVPDGDTGTNMSHTIQAAAREVYKLKTPHVYDVAKAASNGALRGARGNSGVILSQLFRGFAKGLEGKATAGNEDLADALSKASETAYKAVMKPKEGTILTVARAVSEAAYDNAYDEEDIETGLAAIIKAANEMLDRTPSMLPALKQAGVVDSGGLGLVYILKGALEALSIDGEVEPEDKQKDGKAEPAAKGIAEADIRYAYCTEFLIDLPAANAEAENMLKNYLPTIGDSVVVVMDDTIIKVHVHTNHPGMALEKGLQIGALSSMKIENMKEQHTEMMSFASRSAPPKLTGFVAVAAGQGFLQLFSGLGADRVIEGGQTMNPSAEDIAEAINAVNAEHVIILPNNKNIILTAEQAVHLIQPGKAVHVIPTRSIPQGVSCLVSFVDSGDIASTLDEMNEAIKNVHCGQVTVAVRDTVIDGRNIKEGEFLCIYDGDIVFTRTELQAAAKAMSDYMLNKGGDVVSVYYGDGVAEDMAEEISGHITKANPSCEVELYNGMQPIYNYIISVE
jgi:DAK2 domain fusion protein YloV